MRPLTRFASFILAFTSALFIVVAVPATGTVREEAVKPNPAYQGVLAPAQSSGAELGALRIPTIGLDEVVRSGVDLSVIDQGVAQWAGTAAPGAPGNVVLAGHRTTYSRPFHDIDRLDPGDLIYLEDGFGLESIYRVSESFVVDPHDLWITYETDKPTLTMFACHPKGSARFRLVVTAELVAGRPIA